MAALYFLLPLCLSVVAIPSAYAIVPNAAHNTSTIATTAIHATAINGTIHSTKTNATSAATNATLLISSACRVTTVHYDLCVRTLSSHPLTGASISIADLIAIAVDVAKATAINTSTYVDRLNDKSTDTTEGPASQQCLADCADQYLDVTNQLDNAVAALKRKVYQDVSLWVETAQSDAKTCQESCKNANEHKNVLTKQNGDLDRLASIILSLAKLLPH